MIWEAETARYSVVKRILIPPRKNQNWLINTPPAIKYCKHGTGSRREEKQPVSEKHKAPKAWWVEHGIQYLAYIKEDKEPLFGRPNKKMTRKGSKTTHHTTIEILPPFSACPVLSLALPYSRWPPGDDHQKLLKSLLSRLKNTKTLWPRKLQQKIPFSKGGKKMPPFDDRLLR